jgi:hypothetical protein
MSDPVSSILFKDLLDHPILTSAVRISATVRKACPAAVTVLAIHKTVTVVVQIIETESV